MTKKISIVTPTYNEQDNILNLVNAVASEISKYNYDYEHIIIDNCSKDNTQNEIRKICNEKKNVKAIFNSRNFGSIRSSQHAILNSTGDAVILISADLQEPVSLISEYITYWEKGFDAVFGQRSNSNSNVILEFVKKLFYKILNSISENKLIERSGSTALISKKMIDELKKINDPYPYFRGLIPDITSNIKIVPYDQAKRNQGKTKSNFFVLYDHAILGVVKHSKIPLRLCTILGFICSLTALIISLTFFIYKLLFWSSFQVGIAPLVIGLFGVASIQLFLMGLVGEYVMQILTEVRKVPLVVEKERINF